LLARETQEDARTFTPHAELREAWGYPRSTGILSQILSGVEGPVFAEGDGLLIDLEFLERKCHGKA
jgi:hypothetical protein